MYRSILSISVAVWVGLAGGLFLVESAQAWNKAGHMVAATIAYHSLQQLSLQSLERAVNLLRKHPDYKRRWRRRVSSHAHESDRQIHLFMLASRWADDIRSSRHPSHDRDQASWHYINFPFKPKGQPPSIDTRPPSEPNILSAIEKNVSIVNGNSVESKRAMALSWLFHLVGDIHQPLHTTALYTTQYPYGDRGGTRFFIGVSLFSGRLHLHQFWDGLILGSSRFRNVRNRAVDLLNRSGFARSDFPQLSEPRVVVWAQEESFRLAVKHAYRNGDLKGGTTVPKPLPNDYAEAVKPIAERQIVLAGYRLADLLTQLFKSR